MVPAIAGTALLRRHAFAPAAAAALGVALSLYQATSLSLGPAADREISVSLSIPTFDELSLPAPPAAQVLEAGVAAAGRVERSLAGLTVLATEPRLAAADRVRLGAPTTQARQSTMPGVPQAPASVSVVTQLPTSAAHSAAGKRTGSSAGDRPGHDEQSVSAGSADSAG